MIESIGSLEEIRGGTAFYTTFREPRKLGLDWASLN